MTKPTAEKMKKEAARFKAATDFDRASPWVDAKSNTDVRDALVAISVRLPGRQIKLFKAIAEREGVGYQTLMKRWLDDRLREEMLARRAGATAARRLADLSRELEWASREVVRGKGGS